MPSAARICRSAAVQFTGLRAGRAGSQSPGNLTGHGHVVQKKALVGLQSGSPGQLHDPGEEKLVGGLLHARYGEGVYVYTSYSFFRQLPAAVPGAYRLFMNLVDAR